MIIALDHVAVAVDDLQAAIARFAEDFGLVLAGTEEVEAAKTSTAFFPLPGTRIELVHPLRGEGPIAAHLERRGPGLHHLCFRTDDIVADVERLKGKGYRFLSEAPSPGAHGSQVIFLHPKSTGGVLVELSQHGS
ncbi:MAG: methylmalonyl-CoA epimerase [Deltaproteobacteria bacterium]|nr:methylmalonyl-CoA epimerase [Deltaproteobacteria bacterium]